jgi:hypothetical protein
LTIGHCEFLPFPECRAFDRFLDRRLPERQAVDGYLELLLGTLEVNLDSVFFFSGVCGSEEQRLAIRAESSTGSKPIFAAD